VVGFVFFLGGILGGDGLIRGGEALCGLMALWVLGKGAAMLSFCDDGCGYLGFLLSGCGFWVLAWWWGCGFG